jgi:hypothetical protein
MFNTRAVASDYAGQAYTTKAKFIITFKDFLSNMEEVV